MKEQEKFKKTFEKLHASPEVLTEVLAMTNEDRVISMKKKRYIPKVAVAAIAAVIVLGSGTVAFAMDLGGIQRIVQIWIHGDQTNATLTIENGEYSQYSVEYNDSEGNEAIKGGGGVAINEDGSSRPLTEEEVIDHLNAPEVKCEENGRIIVYYLNQTLDITDKFEGDYCFVQLKSEDKVLYMTVQKSESELGSLGYAISPKGYVQPGEFNTSPDLSDEP